MALRHSATPFVSRFANSIRSGDAKPIWAALSLIPESLIHFRTPFTQASVGGLSVSGNEPFLRHSRRRKASSDVRVEKRIDPSWLVPFTDSGSPEGRGGIEASPPLPFLPGAQALARSIVRTKITIAVPLFILLTAHRCLPGCMVRAIMLIGHVPTVVRPLLHIPINIGVPVSDIVVRVGVICHTATRVSTCR